MDIIIVLNRLGRPLTLRISGLAFAAAALIAALAAYAAVDAGAARLAEHWARTGDPRVIGLLEQIRARTDQQRVELWNSTVDRLDQQMTDMRTRLWRMAHLGNEIARRMGFSEEILVEPVQLLPQHEAQSDSPDERISAFEAEFFRVKEQLDKEAARLAQIGQSTAVVAMQRSTVPKKTPIEGTFYRSSSYGQRRDPFTGRRAFHAGYDYAARTGTPVLAGADGIVVHRGRLGNYGKLIEVYHGGEVSTMYGHLSDYRVELGDFVARDQIIGLVGSTGRSTGPHLHYEVRRKGRPRPYSKLIEQLLEERPMVAQLPPPDIQ